MLPHQTLRVTVSVLLELGPGDFECVYATSPGMQCCSGSCSGFAVTMTTDTLGSISRPPEASRVHTNDPPEGQHDVFPIPEVPAQQ